MSIIQQVISAGDKVKFFVKDRGVYVGYVNKANQRVTSLKGCRLLQPIHNAPNTEKEYASHTFLSAHMSEIEVLQAAPF